MFQKEEENFYIQYITSLTPVEKIALNVAQTNISNIFRLKHTVGYKTFKQSQANTPPVSSYSSNA